MHPCMPRPTPQKRVEQVELPAVKDTPQVIYIREVPISDNNNLTEKQTTDNKLKWWHVGLAFIAGYCLASSNTKKV